MQNNPTEQNDSTQQPTKTIQSHYSYDEVIIWLENKGIELYGNHFKILETDYPIVYKLIAYFLKDEPTCFRYGINLNKGILLTGPIGCGKTSLMNLMKYLTATEHKFFVKPCRDISFEFIQDGYQIIHKYSNGKLYQSEPRTYCFDDLGTENNLKYFGNECNVMAEILLSRYDLFISKKLQTHITTNLSATEIETHYGNRVRSRLREMVNLIAYDKSTLDKR
ncbi:ATPase [Flavobacterium columnare]|uniref:ATPase n=1 Tax=Flavobacterium columnare TaxID=996 RepID=UPI000BE8298A|nr:ATPase [Flavobacterium columnare]PDS23610.1 ATPase [Flavobacterium columnare] [Flavobacterium columnare NBRC 100251 = ATCC 23463]GEM57975.1 ATPase [Flavobacterium columnare NBRC 100251 = ATCC 23463]